MKNSADLWIRFAPILITAWGVVAYANSFYGIFVYDDIQWIVENHGLRHLWPPWAAANSSLRVLLFYSLALNFAISGHDVWSYHLFNLIVHLLAALVLYTVGCRILALPTVLNDRRLASGLALAVALLWVVHPLQTQSVTYIIQRGEALMGLFYLLVLYCTLRSFRSARPGWWYGGAVVAYGCGLAAKEVMVTAPLLVWLVDAVLICNSFALPLRRRWPLYAGLVAPVLLAAGWLFLNQPLRLFGLLTGDSEQLSFWQYGLSQAGVLLHYLRLSWWPQPLCLDHAWPAAATWEAIGPQMLCVGTLVLATVWGLCKKRPWSVIGAWFLVILGPTSSVVPIRDLLVEHRMYLPLAAPLFVAVWAGYSLLKRFEPASRSLWAALSLGLVLGLLSLMTVQRNRVYHSEYAIWSDVVMQYPDNARGHNNLGNYLAKAGRMEQAMAHYAEALRVEPGYAEAHINLGNALKSLGSLEEAIAAYSRALLVQGNHPQAHNNLALVYAKQGQVDKAIDHYGQALAARPLYADAHANLGVTLVGLGRLQEAKKHFVRALEINPGLAEAHNNLGSILVGECQLEASLAHYVKAAQIKPEYLDAHINRGIALLWLGRFAESAEQLQGAVELEPLSPKAHNYLGQALHGKGELKAAEGHYRQALHLHPGYTDAHKHLARNLMARGDAEGALGQYREVLRLKPNNAEVHRELGQALLKQGERKVAVEHLRRALALDPQDEAAKRALELVGDGGKVAPH